MLFQQAFDERLIRDVAMDKSISSMPIEILRIRGIAGILKRIEVYNLMAALDHQPPNEMRSDESRPASDEEFHEYIPMGPTNQLVIRSSNGS
jgi:hypothetical protein